MQKPNLSGSGRFLLKFKNKKMEKMNTKLIRLFNNRQPITGVEFKGILTHPSCHLDEFGAIFILQNTIEGQKLFPGIEKVGIGFQTETYLRNNGFIGFKGFIKALEMGYLIIGMGGGPFDEHSNRSEKISCLELIKRHIDLFASKESRSIYGQLINFINHEDNNGDNLIENLNRVNSRKLEKVESDMLLKINLGMLAQNIKKGWEAAETPTDQNQLCSMVMCFFKNETEQRKFFLKAVTEYKEAAEKQICVLPDNHAMVIVKSDNPLMVRAVRQQTMLPGGKKLGVTFVHKSNGQFVIYPSNGFTDKMIEVVKILRQKIAFYRNGKGIGFDKLGQTGTLWEIPELYIDENMKIIMNGSKTDPDVPGLIGQDLSVDDIIEAVILGLDESRFDKKLADKCKSNVCSKNIDPDITCKLFCYNLARCKKVVDNFTQPKRPFADLNKILETA